MDDIALGSTYYTNFCAFRVDTGAPADVASIAVQAYPDNSATQITSGITVTQPDSLTGSYNIAVAATVANGYTFGTRYALKITTGTVNSVSVVGAVVGQFSIRASVPGLITAGLAQSATSTTIVLASATNITDDFLNGATVVIVSGTGAGQSRIITDWVSSTDTATVDTWVTNPDNTSIYEVYATPPASTSAPAPVNATQIGGQTASASGTITFPNATLASTTNITASAGAAVSSIGANVITATAIQDNAITAAKIADGAIDAATFAAGAIDATAIAADAIGASEFSNAAAAKVATQAMTEAYSTAGGTKTIAQALYEINALLSEFDVSTVTLTTRKLDGTTAAATYTLNDATNPTAVERAT